MLPTRPDPLERRAALLAAPMALLTAAPISTQAETLSKFLADEIEARERKEQRRCRPRTAAAAASLQAAVAAFLADLLHGSGIQASHGFVYRSMRANSFSGASVTYRSFAAAVGGLTALNLVETVGGFRNDETFDFGDGGTARVAKGKAARFRAHPELIALAGRYGVSAADLPNHFKVSVAPLARPALVLKSGAQRFGRTKIDGRPVIIAETPEASRLSTEVCRINDFLRTVDVAGAAFHGLYRAFAMGDVPNYRWNKGGRLYAYGDSYQTAKKTARLAMTLNGDPVVEVDIKASHLTVLYALLGTPLEIGRDAYEGLDVPREVAKAWLTATLGKGSPVTRWGSTARDEYRKRAGRDLSLDYRAAAVGAKVMTRYPLLLRLEDSKVTWADLTFKESEAMVGAVLELVEAGVPALPVHDSLIVPAWAETLASTAIESHFERVLGVRPRLKVNRPPAGSRPS